MELWVRSQSKGTLCRVEVLYIGKDTNKIFSDKLISGVSVGFCLGEYKTKERALEVLDEIQGILIDYSQMSRVVYQMPEE